MLFSSPEIHSYIGWMVGLARSALEFVGQDQTRVEPTVIHKCIRLYNS